MVDPGSDKARLLRTYMFDLTCVPNVTAVRKTSISIFRFEGKLAGQYFEDFLQNASENIEDILAIRVFLPRV